MVEDGNGFVEIPEFKYAELDTTPVVVDGSPFGNVDEADLNTRFVHVGDDEMAEGYMDVDTRQLIEASAALFHTGIKDGEIEDTELFTGDDAAPTTPFGRPEMPPTPMPAPPTYHDDTVQLEPVEADLVMAAPAAVPMSAPASPSMHIFHDSALAHDLAVHGVTSIEAEIVLHGPPTSGKRKLFGR